MSLARSHCILLGLILPLAAAVAADDKPQPQPQPASAGQKYLLRYKFQAGETLRWEVEHLAKIRTTVSGTTQTAETTSNSTKRWQVIDVKDDGSARLVHSVENVDMRQKLTGRKEVRYNSQADDTPPVGFEDVAKSVGVPLTEITLDATGNVIHREEKLARPQGGSGHVTIPLPPDAAPIGHEWFLPDDVTVQTGQGTVRRIKTRQKFTLLGVDGDVATIRVATQILSPVDDPAIEAQLIQTETNGEVRFDMAAGRVVQQTTSVDRNVVGFQGATSSLDYEAHFHEKILPDAPVTASTSD